MKAITTTKTIEEIKGYEASDGTFFKDKAECEKYEGTCKCVIMKEFKELVIGECTEFSILDAGSDESGYYIVKINDSHDVEVVNKAIHFFYKNAKLLTSDVIGKEVMVYVDYDGELSGCTTTIDELIESIRKSYEKVTRKEQE